MILCKAYWSLLIYLTTFVSKSQAQFASEFLIEALETGPSEGVVVDRVAKVIRVKENVTGCPTNPIVVGVHLALVRLVEQPPTTSETTSEPSTESNDGSTDLVFFKDSSEDIRFGKLSDELEYDYILIDGPGEDSDILADILERNKELSPPTIIEIDPEPNELTFDFDNVSLNSNEFPLRLLRCLDFDREDFREPFILTLEHGGDNQTVSIFIEDVDDNPVQVCTNIESCFHFEYEAVIDDSFNGVILPLNDSLFVLDRDFTPEYNSFFASFENSSLNSMLLIFPEGNQSSISQYQVNITNLNEFEMWLASSDPCTINISIFSANSPSVVANAVKINVIDQRTTSTSTTDASTSDEITTENGTSTTTVNTTTTISPITSPRPSPTPTPSCPAGQPPCVGFENNCHWEVCRNTSGSMDCNCNGLNTTGSVRWECLNDGKWATEVPDYLGCISSWIGDLIEEKESINDTAGAQEFFERLEEYILPNQNSEKQNYFGHEISNVTNMLREVLRTASNFTDSSDEFESLAEKMVDLTEGILRNERTWHQLKRDARSSTGTDLINAIEEASFQLTAKVNVTNSVKQSSNNGYEKNLSNSTSISTFLVTVYATTKDAAIKQFPSNGDDGSLIRMPPDWGNINIPQIWECVGIFMDGQYAALIMPGQYTNLTIPVEAKNENRTIINGKLLTFTVGSLTSDGESYDKENFRFDGQGVQISFKHDVESWGDEAYKIPRKLHKGETPKAAMGSGKCAFWDTRSLTWSTSGCKIISRSKAETICECSHLTSFALLMDMHSYVGKNEGLEILTWILSSLSIICLIFTLIVLTFVKLPKSNRAVSDRRMMTKNLSICLLFGNLLVLLLLDKTYFNLSQGVCIASGIVIHYIFLSAFGWMCLQGFHLYRLVIKVFMMASSPLYNYIYHLAAYGTPVFIIAVTAIVGYLREDDPYGGEVVCFLNESYLWAFMGPILPIIVANIIILTLSLYKSYKLKTSVNSMGKINFMRTWIKGSITLSMLLGLTWLAGYFMLAPEIPGLIAAYLFVILNASQGIFIFIFDCVLNVKVRQGIHNQIGSNLPATISKWLQGTPLTSPEQSTFSENVHRATPSNSSEKPAKIVMGGDEPPPIPPKMGVINLAPRFRVRQRTQSIHDEVPPPIRFDPRRRMSISSDGSYARAVSGSTA